MTKICKKNQVSLFKTLPGVSVLLSICVAIAFSSCATKVTFATSPVVPAAEGKVKIKKDDNDNYSIELNVAHLEDPKRLTPSKNYCVVWAQTNDGVVKNLGQLKSSTSWYSDTRKASMETVSPFKPNEVFITAEDQVDIPHPMGIIVLNTNKF